MSRIYSEVGTIEREGGRIFLRTNRSETGTVVYGPYHKLGEGTYTVEFLVEPDAEALSDAVCCEVDVIADYGQNVVFKRLLSVGALRENAGKIQAKFELKSLGLVEYRVKALGTAGLRVAYDRKLNMLFDKNTNFSFCSSATDTYANENLSANYGRIAHLASIGVEIEADAKDIIATINDTRLYLNSDEHVTLLTDIFINNCYTTYLPRKCIAIDVGMNVGMASLAFTGNPMIERVYAFEPFATPYARALRNFELNPERSKKIFPHNFGLSDKDAELDVLCEDVDTLGTSVRGLGRGNKETIRLRDAARELKQIIADARRDGLGVFVKMDCEGSEFPIFAALEREGMLTSIDAMVMEWHMWWSNTKTQHDLIRPLVAAGFTVFDRTPVDERLAGMLSAVKAAQS